jgi:lysophospholipase L1-like esterase
MHIVDVPVLARTTTQLTFPSQASCDVLSTETPTFTITAQSTTTIAGAVLTAPTSPLFKYRGGSGLFYGTPFPFTTVVAPNSRYNLAYGTPNNCGESFMFTGTEFEILYYFVNTAGSLRMRVDGKRLTALPVVTTGVSAGGRFVWKVTFPTGGTRRIDLDHNYHHFGGVFLAAGNTIAAVPNPSVRCLLFGDSITNGSTSTTGLSNGTWKQLFDKYCGIDDIWDIAIGGTGYNNRGASPGTTTEALTARLADFMSQSPNVLIVWAGYNDFSFIDSDFRTAVQTVFAAVAAMPASVEKYIWGHWSPTVAQGATYTRHDQILREEAAAKQLPIWMPATGIIYGKTGAQKGTVEPIIRNSTDVANFIQGDAVHPTDAGNTRIAQVAQLAMMVLTTPDSSGGGPVYDPLKTVMDSRREYYIAQLGLPTNTTLSDTDLEYAYLTKTYSGSMADMRIKAGVRNFPGGIER